MGLRRGLSAVPRHDSRPTGSIRVVLPHGRHGVRREAPERRPAGSGRHGEDPFGSSTLIILRIGLLDDGIIRWRWSGVGAGQMEMAMKRTALLFVLFLALATALAVIGQQVA